MVKSEPVEGVNIPTLRTWRFRGAKNGTFRKFSEVRQREAGTSVCVYVCMCVHACVTRENECACD